MVPDRVAQDKPRTDAWSLFEHDASCKQCTFCIDVLFFLVLELAQESDHLCLLSNQVLAMISVYLVLYSQVYQLTLATDVQVAF